MATSRTVARCLADGSEFEAAGVLAVTDLDAQGVPPRLCRRRVNERCGPGEVFRR